MPSRSLFDPSKRAIGLAVVAALAVVPACGRSGEPPADADPSPASVAERADARTAQNQPRRSEPFEDVFVPVNGFEFEDVSRPLEQTQLKAIRASVKGVGHLTESNVMMAVKNGEIGVTVTIAAIEHNHATTPQDVFGALLGSVSVRGRPRPAVGGQAFEVETGDASILLSPIAVEPYLVVLVAISPSNAPGNAVVEGLLREASGQ